MKQRFQIVAGLIATIIKALNERQIKHQLRAKHLYHDRDEITVMILTGAHLLE
jgi:23S rRNA (cytidine2498-2'-O)-methyltransferase